MSAASKNRTTEHLGDQVAMGVPRAATASDCRIGVQLLGDSPTAGASIGALALIRWASIAIACCAFVLVTTGCQNLAQNNLRERLIPTNDRNWVPDLARTPYGELNDGVVTIHNVRNCVYVTENDYVCNFYEETFRLDEIQSVDYWVVPFQSTPIIAHTMLSFGLADGRYLCVSAEIRKEIGEDYSPMLGILNQFELVYVIADERDLIRLRTHHRDAEVYLYPTVATPEIAQRLFVSVMQRVNRLAAKPEFYHTFTNNCTTNITTLVKGLSEKSKLDPLNWQVLLPGKSARYAYEIGLLDQSVPFAELQKVALINDLSDAYYDDPDFSQKIRQRHRELRERAASRQERNDSDRDLRIEIQ